MSVPPKANRIPANETVGASGWSADAAEAGSILAPEAADVEPGVDGLGLETTGEGTAAAVVEGAAAWVGSGATIAAVEGVDAPRGGTATPGSG